MRDPRAVGELRRPRLRRPRRDLRPRPRRLLAELAREPARAGRRRVPRDRARPPRLRPLADAGRRHLDHRLRAHRRRPVRTRSGIGPAALIGNSMGGFTAAEAAISHPDRVERLVLVDAAGISSTLGRNWLSERVGRTLVTGAIGGAAPSDPDKALRMMRRPGFVQIALGAVVRHPTLISRELVAEQLGSLGAPALHARARRDHRPRLHRPARRDRLPDARRAGRQGRAGPDRRRARVRRPHRALGAARPPRHRARPDVRAAATASTAR